MNTTLRDAPANENQPDLKTRRLTEAFNMMAPFALAFIATDGPVSITLYNDRHEVVRRIGHNRGVWPSKIIKGTGRGDPAKKGHRSYAFPARTRFRVWTRTRAERDRLFGPALDLIERLGERDGGLDELEDDFHDLGPDLNVDLFEVEIRDVARELNVKFWNDAELLAFLDNVVVRADEIAARSRGGRFSPLEVALTKELGE
jgi:hypothetical protein